MSEYQEFTGKSVEEAIRQACETFGVGLGDLDFEILTPGSRGVLGMGAEPARIVAAPRTATGGAPRREAAQSRPLPEAGSSEEAPAGRGDRDSDRARCDRDRDRGPRRDDRSRGGPPRGDRDRGPRREEPAQGAPARGEDRAPRPDRPPREDRGPRRGDRDRGPRRDDRASEGTRGGPAPLSAAEMEQVTSARGSVAMERAELEAAEATPETLAQGREILETLMGHLGFTGIRVDVREGETSRLNVVAEGSDRESLGSLIGRKGERLSALQHVVNLMLSRKTGQWTRVLVDVEDYRGRRERQLQDIAQRAAERVAETGKMIQLEPMPALERRWVHLTLRDHPDVATQSIGEEPNRRIVVLPRNP
jgi:spoIIIJ-associated protein